MDMSGAWAGVVWADSRMQILWPGLMLAGALLIGALIVTLVERWRKQAARTSTTQSASDQLASYRALYEQGELSEEEYEQIRAHLGGELRQTARRPSAGAPLLNKPLLPAHSDEPSANGAAAKLPPPEGPTTGIRPE